MFLTHKSLFLHSWLYPLLFLCFEIQAQTERLDMYQIYADNIYSIGGSPALDSAKSFGKYELLGRHYQLQQDYERALIYFQRALLVVKQHEGIKAQKKIELQVSIAEALENLERLEEAGNFYALALKMLENEETKPDFSWVLKQKSINALGAIYLKNGNVDIAFEVLKNGFVAAEKDSAGFKNTRYESAYFNQIAKYYLNIAKYYERQNDYDIATEFYHKSLKFSDKLSASNNLVKSKVQYGLAIINPDLTEKLKLLQKAIVALSDAYKDEYWQSNPTNFQQFSRYHRQMLLTCLNYKIFVIHQRWRRNKEKKGLLDFALQTCHHTTDLIQLIRKDLGDSQTQKELVLPYFLMTFEQGIEMAQSLFRITGDAYYFDEAYFFTEQNKALLLAEARTAAKVWEYAELSASQYKLEKDLKNAIAKAEIEIEKSKRRGDFQNAKRIENHELFEAIWNYDAFRHSLKKNSPELFNQQFNTNIPEVQKLQQQLDNETIIVEYSMNDVLDDRIYRSDNRTMYIYTIGNVDLSITVTAWNEELDKKISEFYHLLQKATIVRKKRKEKFIKLGQELYDVLLRPIRPYLQGAKRIIFIGEDKLNYLPFEVLLTKEPGDAFQEMPFLLKEFEISYHYSATLLYDSFQNRNDEHGGMLSFAPTFEKESLSQSLFIEDRFFEDTTLSFVRSGKFLPLKWTIKEVETIDSLFIANNQNINTLLLHNDAREALLKQFIEKPYKYIHIATHSFANLKRPDYSGIACLPEDDESAEEDGILYVNEIYNLSLQADLVTLSSCESGVGELLVGEGMLGLNRAFIYAGAPNVLFSLWKVNDKTTSELMIDFYKQVVNGQPYAKALHLAKLKLLEQKQSALPLYWSAFQLIGR